MNGRSTRIGIAVGADTLTGVARTGATTHVVSVPLSLDGSDIAAALRDAVARLRAQLDAAAGRSTSGAAASMAVLPPLSDVRLVQLPPLRPAEALAVLRRDAGRYFVAVPAPRVTGIRTPRRGTGISLAAAAGEPLVNAMRSAVVAAGWTAGAVAPGAAAWVAAAHDRATPRAVIAVTGDTAHVIGCADGAVTMLRRIPASDDAGIAQALAELPPGPIAVYAEGYVRERIVRNVTTAGWSPAGLQATAPEAAARYASDAGVQLVSSGVAAERRVQEKRIAIRLAAAALVLVIAAAVVELWGTQRALNDTRLRRSAIRANVEPLIALRDSADRLSAGVSDVDSLARAIPRWTGALFDLAMLLPPETYVTRLYATGDTLVVDAEGARAGEALQALRGAGTLRDVKLLGSVDRQLTDGATTAERFRISARLAGARPQAGSSRAAPRAEPAP